MRMGFFLGLFHILYNQSVMHNGAAMTTVMQAAIPTVVVIVAFYLWKEALTLVKIGSMLFVFIGTFLASLILLPLQPFTRQPFPLNPTMLYAFWGLIAISTIGAFTLHLLGVKYIQVGIASILVMSELLFGCVYAFFLLGERLSIIQI